MPGCSTERSPGLRVEPRVIGAAATLRGATSPMVVVETGWSLGNHLAVLLLQLLDFLTQNEMLRCTYAFNRRQHFFPNVVILPLQIQLRNDHAGSFLQSGSHCIDF